MRDERHDGRVKRFEDLVAWQRSCDLAIAVFEVTRLPTFAREYTLVDQMKRAAMSIGANIAEGHERGAPGDFSRFLMIAKGSCAELRHYLYLARKAGMLEPSAYQRLHAEAEEVGRIIGGLRASVERRR
jgi:four helix bundle protein